MSANFSLPEQTEPSPNDLQREVSLTDSKELEQIWDDKAADHSRNALASVTVININGKQFVAGLFWQPLTQPRTYLKEAREMGKCDEMKWLVLQRASIFQAGFAGDNAPVRQGMFSLAAVLARKLGRSWVGIFPLQDECYALVAVNDGAIIPGCDMIAKRQSVEAKLNAIYRHFSWENIYLPADFGFDGENLDLNTLLKPSDLKRDDQLRCLTFSLSTREIYIVSAIIALALITGFIYLQWQAKQEQRVQETSRREHLPQFAQLKTSVELTPQPQPPQIEVSSLPWASLPLVDDFLKPCMQAIEAMPLVVGGWKFEAAKCTGQLAGATYLRGKNATANDFLVEARDYFKVKPAFYQQGKNAVIQTNLDWQINRTVPRPSLLPLAAALAAFSSHFQALGIQLTLTEKNLVSDQLNQLPLLPGQQNTETALKPDWHIFIFSISTHLAPDIVFSGLNTDSIRLTELSVNLQDSAQLNWQMAGEIYAK